MPNTKKYKAPTFFRGAIPSILADTNAVLVETFARQEDHLQIKDILKENQIKVIKFKVSHNGTLVYVSELVKSIHSATQSKFYAVFK